ncbi:hypothetical protein V8V91_08470 [Algoriphagus halophilus]|uniref:hypothetical protein n=1 Tax=Algoriphagus halophilus TaxID=226505 RepID=UPI00358E3FE7
MELSANKIYRTVAANPANYGLGNYQLYGELRVEQVPGSGAYTQTLTAKITPDSSDNCVFQLQDGLADFFPFTDFNPYGVVGMQAITDNVVKAQFYQAEVYGDPQVIQTLSLVDTFNTLNGGIPKQISEDFMTEILPVTKQFLTWHPVRKRVTQAQPEILHFLVYNDLITELNLLVKLYFTDGTDSTHTIDTVTGVEEEQLYRLPAGYTLLGLSTLAASKTVKKYELWLTDQADATVSEVRTFAMDYLDTPETRFWLFTNSLGVFEIMRTEGRATEVNKVDREISTNYLPNGYDRTIGEIQSRVLGMTESLEISTGFLDSRLEAHWAKEILLAEKVFLLTVDERIPYRITTNDYNPSQDKNFRWFLRFSATLAYNNTKYSSL